MGDWVILRESNKLIGILSANLSALYKVSGKKYATLLHSLSSSARLMNTGTFLGESHKTTLPITLVGLTSYVV